MSEEEIEIIERIEDTFLYSDLDRRISKLQKLTIYEDGIKDIKKLLDLYNKEKEKNKSIEAQRLRDMCYKTDGNYISKDKIKEKIKELENYIQENSDEQGYWGREHQEEIYAKIEILQELLEERN